MGVKIIKSFIVIILSVMCSYIVAAAIYNRGWSTPQTILKWEPYYDPYSYSFAGGLGGSWHLIYGIFYPGTEIESAAIKYLNSDSEHYAISETGLSYPLSVDMSPDGRLHVAYLYPDTPLTLKYIYKDTLGQWSKPQTILEVYGDLYDFRYSIIGGPGGSWHLVYRPADDENPPLPIKYLNSDSERYTIAETNYKLGGLSADIGPDGRIHVAYSYLDTEDLVIAIKHMYKDTSGQWSKPQTILKGNKFNYFYSIVGGPEGNWHLFYKPFVLESPIPIKYLNSDSEHYTITETNYDVYNYDFGNMGPDGRMHVAYLYWDSKEVIDSEEEVITMKYMYKTTDKLKLLIIPVNWQGSYASFKKKAENISKYYLERIPLKDCPEQFEVLISEEENYGPSWVGWQCPNYGIIPPKCSDNYTLHIIDVCATQYKLKTGKDYDFVAGITDRDICEGIAGWSDGQGGLPAVIAESTFPGVVTHELGHEFALADEYCDCEGVAGDLNGDGDTNDCWGSECESNIGWLCGPKAPYNPLEKSLGCNYDGDCCQMGSEVYPGCYKWCYGNYDRMWSIGIGLQRSTMSNKILEGETGHHDINEYVHLKTISQFKCDSSKVLKSILTTMSSNLNNNTTSVYADPLLTVDLIVFNNDTVIPNRIDISFGYTPLIYPEPGDYSLRILDQFNNTVYDKNTSLHFILFSDPPKIVNYTHIYDKIPFYNSMRKLGLYHGDNLIFSQDLDFCNYNTSCDENENYYSCPSDCLPYEQDGICNKEKDDGCDLDCLAGIDPDCSIFLQPGWNLISIPFNISNKTAEWLCNQVNCSLIFAFHNQTWKYYYPTQLVNTLDDFDETMGLWIKVSKTLELSLEGSSFEKAEINLLEGWNLVGYPLLYTSSINETLPINFSSIYTYKDNEWYSYVKERNDSLNSLESFTLGYGYWIYSNNETKIKFS